MCIVIFFLRENWKSAFAVITTDSSFRVDLGRPFFDNWNDQKSLRNGKWWVIDKRRLKLRTESNVVKFETAALSCLGIRGKTDYLH